mmetsp:Transcript_9786/g.18338  ORF Transcript_9786/g.18338 Transcript_9786/m.18338 type:complete len:159 (-) Transcript_9786:6-482(-)
MQQYMNHEYQNRNSLPSPSSPPSTEPLKIHTSNRLLRQITLGSRKCSEKKTEESATSCLCEMQEVTGCSSALVRARRPICVCWVRSWTLTSRFSYLTHNNLKSTTQRNAAKQIRVTMRGFLAFSFETREIQSKLFGNWWEIGNDICVDGQGRHFPGTR